MRLAFQEVTVSPSGLSLLNPFQNSLASEKEKHCDSG